MPGKLHHEALYRGEDLLRRLAELRIVVCGGGAVGSNVLENLARTGARNLAVIDDDRVEEHNLSTQIYAESDIGVFKVEAIRNRLFRAVGCEVEPVRKRLDESNAKKLLQGAGLVIDGFDNSASRLAVQKAVRVLAVPCLHVGLAADYAEAIWDENYRVPNDVAADVCDYPLSRSIVLLAAAVAGELVLRSLATGRREDWSVTLGDFAIRQVLPSLQSPAVLP
jgi:molybdopterin-synthase adenylyltransferase